MSKEADASVEPRDIERPDRTIETVRLVQRVSAIPIAAFLFLHLASPACAALSPSPEHVANQLMLAARELYKTVVGEWLLFGGAFVHVASGLAARLARSIRLSKRGKQVPTPSLHARAGYALLPVAGLHVYLHRVLPSSDWMSFSFVGFALGGGSGQQSRQSRSRLSSASGSSSQAVAQQDHISNWGMAANVLAYGSLISIAAYHALVGLKVILYPMDARKLDGRPKWKGAYVALVSAVGVGAARIATSMDQTPGWIAAKYLDVLRKTCMS